MKDKISVAMTTYNGEKYLREQLDSLYSQTQLPDEIIVVDDCSTDNTTKILEEYHQKYGLSYYVNKINLGVNKNFEKAIMLCQGDYIALCDQDDIWLPHKIETSFRRIKLIEKGEPALVSSRNISVDENLNIISIPKPDVDSDNYATTLLGHHSQGSTLMMNKKLKSFIIPLPEDEKVMYDIYIGLTSAMIGNKYNLSEPLLYYRRHSTNLCGAITVRKQSVFDKFKNKYKQQYPGLLSDERFYNMRIVSNFQKSNFIAERKKLFYNLLSLEQKTSLIGKLEQLLKIKEISFIKKIEIIINTTLHHLFKKKLTN